MRKKTLSVSAALLACAAAAWGQADTGTTRHTYTCTNAKGRNITSDRPIAECVDRVQRVLNSNGLEVRRIGPTLTDSEYAEMEAARRQIEADKAREREERARARALMVRYPNQQAHEQARAAALERVEQVASVARQRQQELRESRADIEARIQKWPDPKQVPLSLTGQLEENQNAIDDQQRFLDEREQEKVRLNERFDEELRQLRRIWSEG